MEEIFEWIKYSKERGPQILMLSPTDHCNLNCKTCWRLRKNMKFASPPFNFLIKMIRQAKEIDVKTIDLTGGGEPFLRKDILKLMNEVKRLKMKGLLTTNGTLIQKRTAEKIVEFQWDELNFSLDGSTPSVNDYIRGKGVFQKCFQNIKLVQKIKKIKRTEKPHLRLNFTITQKNLEDIPGFLEFSNEIGITNINFSVLFEWETNKEFWVKKTESKKVNKFLNEGIKTAKKLGIKTNLEVVKKHGLWEHKPPKFCFAPWYMLFIDASQKPSVCCTLASLHKRFNKIKDLKKFWFGKEMESLREQMKRGILFEECKRCLPDFTEMFNQMYEGLKKWS
jgi:MoaA/NifB/PqqE/SkfB family radical SAM enzyme